eukprot:GEMP01066630.1.p1 GENE.GEMP01066630.1~~GEMP01066630.1.p1  ORF type:complete len:239 (+),score=59.93 GEMP01066630.1:106-822(+)
MVSELKFFCEQKSSTIPYDDEVSYWPYGDTKTNDEENYVVVRLRYEVVKTEPVDDSGTLISLSQQRGQRKRMTAEEKDEAQYRLDMNQAHDASYSDHKKHRADQQNTEFKAVENGDFLSVLSQYDDALVNRIFDTLPIVADALLQEVKCRTQLYELLRLKQRSVKWFGEAASEYCREKWEKFAVLTSGEVKDFLEKESAVLSASLYSMPEVGHWLPPLFQPYMPKVDRTESHSDCEAI